MELDREKIIPHLKQKARLDCYEVQGSVYSAEKFVAKYAYLLKAHEQKIIQEQLSSLGKDAAELFSRPIANVEAASVLVISSEKSSLKKIGSRSAYLEEKKLKLKGCRPMQDGLYFPHEKLDFGNRQMTTTKIPFGVLTDENVMREILAYCFLQKNSIQAMQQPAAVFEYADGENIIGYCLLSYSQTEARLEAQEEFYGMTVRSLVTVSEMERRLGLDVLGKLDNFSKVSNEWYAEKKSDLMIKMNFNGGFRGVLNSNVGNDIEYQDKFYICDFDTFEVINMPEKPDYEFIRSFVLWSIIEMLKSSPLVFAYVNMDGLNRKEVAEHIWEVYTKNSLLWQKYYQKFLSQAMELGWDANLIEKAVQDTVASDVFYDMAPDNVIASEVLKNTYQPEMSFYTKQG
ncbi:MAG: hypothetical protein Q8L10_02345 [Candidatus Moranbacteria bacterium]|nr:hypothetical protein [Candidatus Moranbacteria bacterium]